MENRNELKKSLSRYAYWNFLFGQKRPTDSLKGIQFKSAGNCQAACAPGDPCSAPQ